MACCFPSGEKLLIEDPPFHLSYPEEKNSISLIMWTAGRKSMRLYNVRIFPMRLGIPGGFSTEFQDSEFNAYENKGE